MELRTIRSYNFSEVSSAMQKAIRRGETQMAGYWALELWASGFGNYVLLDYAFDCHTRSGKRAGATKAQFFSAEHAALRPFQPGLFDDLVDC
jgi:hypothetical protein